MLTERQIQLLSAIIKEYLDRAEPIGSLEIVTKYKLNCSAATIRNEMAKLLEDGFLEMIHTSSGRIPTPMAYRFFLNEVMNEEEIPVLQEVAMKQRLWPVRFDLERLLRQAVSSLADITNQAALATEGDTYVTYAGSVNLLDHREFWDINAAKTVLHLMDHPELLDQIFSKVFNEEEEVKCVIGKETGQESLENVGIVFAEYSSGNKGGYLAVIGPSRMRYSFVIPAVRYTKNLLGEFGDGL